MSHHAAQHTSALENELLNTYYVLYGLVRTNMPVSDVILVRKAVHLLLIAGHELPRSNPNNWYMRALSLAIIIIKEFGVGARSVVCAILYRAVDTRLLSWAEAQDSFDEEVIFLIKEVIKIEQISLNRVGADMSSSKNLKGIASRDSKGVLIALMGCLHDMRTLALLPTTQQATVILEAQNTYIPLAHELGLYPVKTELEDLYFKYTSQAQYEQLQGRVEQYTKDCAKILQRFQASLENILKEVGINHRFKSRIKSVYSIWNKMHKRKVAFEEIYDLFAMRIILDVPLMHEKHACWRVYSAITSIYKPHKKRMRNWISKPKKETGYESLHATVMITDEQWVEVQIRTKRMDTIAERGHAAHWKYKRINATLKQE